MSVDVTVKVASNGNWQIEYIPKICLEQEIKSIKYLSYTVSRF